MSTHQQPPSQPEIPAELWMLLAPDDSEWIKDGDWGSPASGLVVCLSAADAMDFCDYLADKGQAWAIPVRVK
jgi:hypothetical protein